ncbi:MAG: xylan 1,4-beta-xylosidase, partial [Clostridiales bacterium]|nr:xylan 1,4-beta-xylosidase [Clostridiales bacterium]
NPRCPTHDTIYNAAVICGMLSRMGDVCDSYSYWTFSDVFEEVGPYDRPFHGGFGLLADHGIRKPTFWAYRFFADLKGKCLLHEDDAIVTLDDKGIYHGVVWNMCQGEKKEKKISLKVDRAGGYLAVLRIVDHDNGNPLRVWHEMGEPCTLSENALRVLKEAAEPAIRAFRMEGDTLEITLSPNAVIGLELIPECKGMSPGYEYPGDEN